jgi:hypothetical protein
MRTVWRIGGLVLLLAGGCVSRQNDAADGSPVPIAVAVEPATAPAPAIVPPSIPPPPVQAAATSGPASQQAAGEPIEGEPIKGEQITVVGRSFTGLWKVNSPKRLGMDVGLLSGVQIRYSGETGDRDICELKQTGDRLDARCLRLGRDVDGSIDGNQITLKSWIGPANLILTASAQSGSHLTGSLSGGALGARMTAGVPIEATKLDPAAEGTERPSAPLVRDVLSDIGGGRLTAGRYAPEAAARLKRELSDLQAAQGALGPLTGLTYLAPLLPRHPFDPREHPLEVYRVDYAKGTQLCGISPGATGLVEDFICR